MNRLSHWYAWIAIAASALQFIIFKNLYPFPDFISDSYSYIATNLYGMKVNLWPIGYSKYIAFIHFFTASDTFLVFTQYFLVQAALLYFFYSIVYIYGLSKKFAIILFIFLFFNPLYLYLANCVLSDALFLCLSLLWFTQMCWMLYSPKKIHILTIALLLGALFTLRYASIYYPIVSLFAFWFSKHKPSLKLLGMVAPFLLIIPFILYTQQKTKEVTGHAQFSVFGGWQTANNALYMYDYIDVDSAKLPQGTDTLDRMVRQYLFDVPIQYRNYQKFPGTYFIKMPDAPLKKYMEERYHFEDAPGQFKAWGKVSPIYSAYGSYLVRNNPGAFMEYYLWLNTKNYFNPHLEKFGSYNLGSDSIGYLAQYWFHYKSPLAKSVSKTLQGKIFYIYPALFMILNFYVLACFLWLLTNGRLNRINPMLFWGLSLLTVFLVLNFCFSVSATPVCLRHEILPTILLFLYPILTIKLSGYILNKDQPAPASKPAPTLLKNQ